MKIHLQHPWGSSAGAACSSEGVTWERTTDWRKVTCERCEQTVYFNHLCTEERTPEERT